MMAGHSHTVFTYNGIDELGIFWYLEIAPNDEPDMFRSLLDIFADYFRFFTSHREGRSVLHLT